ncbi:uncharacterized protein LOC135817424 [Sycon ciliatum]|uniref:uncharacterized protein LOC135817424 n=1 Tax=Sycon ciliatum TaxID=27933 RepID=UPI0031F6B99D
MVLSADAHSSTSPAPVYLQCTRDHQTQSTSLHCPRFHRGACLSSATGSDTSITPVAMAVAREKTPPTAQASSGTSCCSRSPSRSPIQCALENESVSCSCLLVQDERSFLEAEQSSSPSKLSSTQARYSPFPCDYEYEIKAEYPPGPPPSPTSPFSFLAMDSGLDSGGQGNPDNMAGGGISALMAGIHTLEQQQAETQSRLDDLEAAITGLKVSYRDRRVSQNDVSMNCRPARSLRQVYRDPATQRECSPRSPQALRHQAGSKRTAAEASAPEDVPDSWATAMAGGPLRTGSLRRPESPESACDSPRMTRHQSAPDMMCIPGPGGTCLLPPPAAAATSAQLNTIEESVDGDASAESATADKPMLSCRLEDEN